MPDIRTPRVDRDRAALRERIGHLERIRNAADGHLRTWSSSNERERLAGLAALRDACQAMDQADLRRMLGEPDPANRTRARIEKLLAADGSPAGDVEGKTS